jgi:asparagine synthase (glutamine-hydrolysing)
MLDNAVVDLSIRVPSRDKMRGFELRSFYKSAMRNFLPLRVIEKEKHGFGLPFGTWAKSHAPLADFVYSSLRGLANRNIVNPTFVDRVIGRHRSEDDGYYGTLIWDLVILEEWLKANSPDTTERTFSRAG